LNELLFSSVEGVLVETVEVIDTFGALRAHDLRRASTRSHPQVRGTDRAAAVDAGVGRSVGRSFARGSGWVGAQVTDAFKVPVSRKTLLRLIASLPVLATVVPRVDEYTQRKGRCW
jgi:hypothetical protein